MSDVTSFRIKAEQYRRLARGISDPQLSAQLETLACEFDAQAAATEQRGEASGNALSCTDLALASPRTCTSLTKDGVGWWPTFDASDSMPTRDEVASNS